MSSLPMLNTIFIFFKTLSDESVAPINCSLATMVNAISHIPQNGHFNTALVQVGIEFTVYLFVPNTIKLKEVKEIH